MCLTIIQNVININLLFFIDGLIFLMDRQSILNNNNILLYQQNSQIHINSNTQMMDKIELNDVQRRLIFTQNKIDNNNTVIDQPNIQNQILIVKIYLENNTEKVRKIVY